MPARQSLLWKNRPGAFNGATSFDFNILPKKAAICIGSDTAAFFIQQEEFKVRFLLVDTPEIATHDAYSQEAKEYTCRFLQEAKVIELENDGDDVKYDKYT